MTGPGDVDDGPATDVTVLAVDCSPTGPGRTATALEAVLAAATSAGARGRMVHLCGPEAMAVAAVTDAMADADAFVFGSPMYRATFAWPFKALMDATPRGMWNETPAPLTGHAAVVVGTAASDHHFLGLRSMRDVLVDFFAAHVVSPGLYVPHAGFTEERSLAEAYDARARQQGAALVELARAIADGVALSTATPYV